MYDDDKHNGTILNPFGILAIGALLLFFEIAGSSTPDRPWPIVILIVTVLSFFFFKKGLVSGIKKFTFLGAFIFFPLLIAYINRMPNWLFLLCFLLCIGSIGFAVVSRIKKRTK